MNRTYRPIPYWMSVGLFLLAIVNEKSHGASYFGLGRPVMPSNNRMVPGKELLSLRFLLCTSIHLSSNIKESIDSTSLNPAMMEKMQDANGFLAALDQSGGSTPSALKRYGVPKSEYAEGDESMYEAVHEMRTRIMTSKSFSGEKIIGAILFEDTIDRKIEGVPTAKYLWEKKRIVPFLKIDKGLEAEYKGVQLMKPIENLDNLLKKAKQAGCFGTKMRSVIKSFNEDGIRDIVEQQFELGKQVLAAGLIPIIEPEVDINSPDKKKCEEFLKSCIMQHLNTLEENQKIILKLSLPSVTNLYHDFIAKPNLLCLVALSGGYSQLEANELLSSQSGMIGSFSRALTEGLNRNMSNDEFDKVLGASIDSIYKASTIR